MKIKVGTKFKSIEGSSKGKIFTIIDSNSETVTYRSEETGEIYTAPRKHFEKYLERVHRYWNETNKAYKNKKNMLKNNF